MMVLKRKEIVAAALVVLIGVAGYLNWSYQDTMKVTDGGEYIETGKKLGEAQLVNKAEEVPPEGATEEAAEQTAEETAAPAAYFEEARKNREESREKALDILSRTAENESFDEVSRKQAQDNILAIASAVEREASVENIIKAKGYSETSCYIDGETVEILIKKDDISEDDVMKLSEIATSQLGIAASNVKIIPVK